MSEQEIIKEGPGAAVVAPKEYDAIQAASQLKVTWKESAILPTPGGLFKQMRAQDTAGLAKAVFTVNNGNIDSGMASAAKTVSQSYTYQNGSRAVIGPACAVADVKGNSATVWSSTQNVLGLVTPVAGLLSIPAANVRVVYYEGSSSFGSAQSSSDTPKAQHGCPSHSSLLRRWMNPTSS